jgi:hypothetical protein
MADFLDLLHWKIGNIVVILLIGDIPAIGLMIISLGRSSLIMVLSV